MKKILSLLCLMMLAIMSAWADDVKVTWAMGENTEAVATPDGYATGAIVLGDGLTNEGSYTWSEIAFTKFQPTASDKGTNGHASAESMKKYVDFKVTPVGGKFTPTKVSFDIIKIGTGDPTMFVDFIDGEGNTITVADNVAIRRNQDATDAISHSFTISSAAASENAATLRILVGKLANNKQVGIANVVVEGIWASSAKTVTFTNDANWEKVFVWAWNSEENFTGGTWPGQELTADVEGKYIWSTMGNPTQIIFNDGGDNKTGDLQFKDGGQYNSTGRIITLNDYTATFTTDGWDNVWAYVWNSDEKALGDWPDTQLEGANGIFNVVIKGEEAPTFIIFHNNAGQQTPDLPFENGKAYEYMMNTYTASFKTDTWKDVYAYAWNGDGDETVKLVGDYPGLQLSAVDGIYTFTYKSFSAPEKILFNNGGTGDGNQTGNYKFVDGKKYQYMTGTPLYTLTDGTVFTAGQTVEVKDGENVVATITYSEAGGNDFNAVTTEYGTVEGWAAFAAMTTGNETNGNAEGGTFYTIKPVFDGIISVAVRLNGGKKFHIAEDGTDLPAYNGWTIPEAMNTTYDFAVKAGSTYKIWCDGSKLGFFGFDYTGYKEEPTAVTATFNFADPNFRANIGETMTDVAGYIYNETFTAEGVSLQITGGSAPSRIYVDNNRGQNLVTYKEYTTLTFRAPEGKAITKIEFTAAGNSNINNFTASSGAIEGMTWTGNAAGVRFLQGGTSYLANAIVTLEATTAETAVLPAIEYVECENIAAFNALEAGTYAKITLTNAEVIGKSADGYSTVWVQDATGGAWIQYTSLNDRLQEGTKVNGTVFTIKRFTAGNPQLKEAEATINSEIASEAISSYTIVEGTIAEVNVAENLNKVVKISGATLTMTSATAGKLTIGEETIDVNNGNETANQALHKIADWEKDKVLENITITAILVAKSATANQLLPISIEQTIEHTYTVAGAYKVGEEEQALFFGETWNPALDANLMTKQEDGTYTITFENVTFEQPGTILYKVCEDKAWDVNYGFDGNNADYIINEAGTAEKVTFTFNPNAEGYKVSCTVKFPDSELLKEAKELAADADAVAVGKLLAAIEVAETGDESGLQAAIEQFKADNAPLEADVTSQFPVDYQGWAGATGFVGWAAPEVTTNDGRKTAACERYEGTCANTGDVFTRTLTGLANGTYRIELYGAAAFTSGRGFESELVEGDETAVYLYAETADGTVKQYIPAHVADNFNDTGIATAVLDGVVISDGTVKLGMYKDKAYTNWHVVQIKGVTALVLAKDLYVAEQAELTALIAKADILQGENGKAEFQAVLAIAKEATDAKKNWYNVTEIESIIANLKAAMENYKKANWFIDLAAGDYYVINATTGLKMAAGHNYGTRGIVNEAGLDLILTPYEESRTVTFNSRVSNGGNSQFLGENLYMDSSEWGWALVDQGSGFFYILEPNSYKYINLDADNNLVLSETPCEWIIVSKDGVRAQLLEEMAEATKDNPVDATGLIVAPNFNRNDLRNAEAWTVSEDCNNKNLSGGNQENNCAESYHSTFTIMQTISDCPAGSYELTAQGFYRQDDVPEGEETPAAPVFFANEINGNVPVKTGEENGMSDASASFTNGLYTIEPIKFEVKEDGMMYIGITASTNTQWVIWDNFQLKYFGNVSTGIATVNTTVEQNNNGIYNLAGQRVVKAQKGLYIINGKKVVK